MKNLRADLILHNANVITLNSAQPHARMLAVHGDRILLVGDDENIEALRGVKTHLIDCGGRTVLPGFNDAHCHVFSVIRKLLGIDLSPPLVRSIGDIKRLIGEKVRNTPPGQWLSGTGYNEFYLSEKRHPTRYDLDEVSPRHPVVLSHRSLHACVLNSLAMKLAGITRETGEPEGCIIERDLATGEPNGVLYEMLGYIRKEVLPPLSDAEIEKGLKVAGRHYLEMGITSLQEATVTNDLSRWQMFQRLKQRGILKSRLSLLFGVDFLEKFKEAGLVHGVGEGGMRLGGVKLMLTMSTGRLQPTQEELNEQVLLAQKSGFPVAIHAVEEEAVEAATIALENARKVAPHTGLRHRIEHCSECPARLIKRLKQVGAVIVTQPPFLYYSGERYLALVPPEKQRYLYPFKSLIQGGLVVAGSSDAPLVPDNPLAGIYGAVTRKAESGQPLSPDECINVEQALAMYTVNAAYADFVEKDKGSLMTGKLADMVVLSEDITKVPADKIKDVRVEMTIIGGEVAYCA